MNRIECNKSVITNMNQIPYCLPCRRFKVFKHATQKNKCVICVGSSVCEKHNRIKSQCRDCCGSQICVEHNRIKSQCRDCGGSQICKEHGRQKSQCKDCGGSQICVEHGRQKSHCKDCGGASVCKKHNRRKSTCRDCGNVVEKTIRRFINDSRNADKKNNRFDEVNFIDESFCKTLIEESNSKCCYCQCDLDFVKFGSNMITIERIDNSLGHIKTNVKIACHRCNVSHVGSK